MKQINRTVILVHGVSRAIAVVTIFLYYVSGEIKKKGEKSYVNEGRKAADH